MTLVDRPYPVDYEHRGVNAKIHPIWAENSNPTPKGIRVEIDHAGAKGQLITDQTVFSSFDEAIEHGKLIAQKQIDRLLDQE